MNRRESISLLALAPLATTEATAEEASRLADDLLKAASALGDRSLGDADAPVVIIEYASATCPHCAEFHQTLYPVIKSEYIATGKARYVFREFPLDDLSLAVAMLVRCVPEDKFFDSVELVFKNQETWIKGDRIVELLKILEPAGLDRQGMDACLQRKDLAKAIMDTAGAAKRQFDIRGTPAIFINGEAIDGHQDMNAVKAAIDRAMAK